VRRRGRRLHEDGSEQQHDDRVDRRDGERRSHGERRGGPQQPVTRAQAAVVLNVIGSHAESTSYENAPRSVAKMLTATPAASPTP
jgi:hypothetical protein